MRIIGITCVRNEADIIEAFVRHTLAFCNELILIENGSSDATPEILLRLKHEGLAVHVIPDATIGNVQVDMMNRLMRMAAHDFSADWIISVDADEFLIGPEAGTFLPEPDDENAVCHKVSMRTYYCTPDDPPGVLNPVERMTKRLVREPVPAVPSAPYLYKSIVPGKLACLDRGHITQGNHLFYVDGAEAPCRFPAGVWLAHFSLRSPGQYAVKLATQHIRKFRLISAKGDENPFYEKAYRGMKRSFTEFLQGFHGHSLTYHPSRDENALVSDPIQYMGGPLRYTASQGGDVDLFVERLLDFAENLAVTAGENGAGKTGEAPVPPPHFVMRVSCRPDRGGGQEGSVEGARGMTHTLNFPLDCPVGGDGIWFHFLSDPGMLEISEVTLLYQGGPTTERTFGASELNTMLSVETNAAMIHCEHKCRLLVSSQPVTLIFDGWKGEGMPAPVAMRIKLRYDDRLVPGVILDQSVLNTINWNYHDLLNQRRRADSAESRVSLLENSSYFLGFPIDFTSNGNAQLFIADGWGPPEPWGIWTVGEKSTLRIRFPELPSTGLILCACVKSFATSQGGKLQVRVFVDDEPLGSWFLAESGFRGMKVRIPAGKIKSRDCKIHFEIGNPVSPHDLDPKSTDTRKLGVGFRSMVIRRPRFPWL